jgi:hypothetical protein
MARTISGGGVSLSRNPLALARRARSTWSSASKVVSTITCGASGSARMRSVASRPPLALGFVRLRRREVTSA